MVRALAPGLVAALAAALAGCGGEEARDGTYRGPNDAVVVVVGDHVTRLELRYAGNVGLAFASGYVQREGMFPIQDGAFTVLSPGATVEGRFVGGGTIEGTWREGPVSGTWSARK